MSSKIEILEKNRARITMNIPAERFEEGMKFSYNKNKGKLKLPGFRAGKVPRALAEKQFGPEIFLDDAINFCFPDAYEDVKKELNLEAVSTPELDNPVYDKENGMTLTFDVWTKPEITLGKYKGLSYKEKDSEVSDEEIQDIINKELEQNARVVSVSDRAIKDKDAVIIDFEGYMDGEPFDGGTASGYELVIGSKTFIDTFEEQLIGKNVGDELDVSVTFPENYGKVELQGKPAVFKVRINEITEKVLPEADDEFAQDISEFDTMDEYKNSIKEKLINQKELDKERDTEEQLITAAVKNVEFDVPEIMYENQVERMVAEFERRLSAQRLNIDVFLQYSGKTKEELKESYRESAEIDVKARLVLEAIANAENYEPTDEEVNDEIKRIAEAYGFEEEAVKRTLRDEDMKGLIIDLKTQKGLEILKENAVKE